MEGGRRAHRDTPTGIKRDGDLRRERKKKSHPPWRLKAMEQPTTGR